VIVIVIVMGIGNSSAEWALERYVMDRAKIAGERLKGTDHNHLHALLILRARPIFVWFRIVCCCIGASW